MTVMIVNEHRLTMSRKLVRHHVFPSYHEDVVAFQVNSLLCEVDPTNNDLIKKESYH